MECDICSRRDVEQVGFHCTVCAQTAIYAIRIETARLLLEKEELGQTVEQVVSVPVLSDATEDVKSLAQGWQSETRKTHLQAVKDRLEIQVVDKAATQTEITRLRDDIEQKRAENAQRRKALKTIAQRVPDRQRNVMNRLNEIRKRGTRSFGNINNSSGETRAFLCKEAASLLRLKQKKVKDRAGQIHERYWVAGHLVPDLKYIHNARCPELTATLSSFAHLVVLISFYLGIRLPAEITLPHRDYPLATITHPTASYSATKVQFPGSGSNVSLSSSPSSSKHDLKAISKPRPLFIGSEKNETLSIAAKYDPTAYIYFLEALSLLAWDVMWLGQSQGFVFGKGSWEDACNIGRNLWQLIFAPLQSVSLPRTLSSRDVQGEFANHQSANTSSPKISSGKLGSQSHASAHNFLGYTTGKEQLRPMKVGSFTMILDPLRKALGEEIKNAEWILLTEQEYDDGEERFDLSNNAVLLRPPGTQGNHYNQTRSILTSQTQDAQIQDTATNEQRVKGKSGWTMVKNRDNAP